MAMRDLRSLPPNPIPRGARLHFAQTHGLGTGESHEHGTDEPTKGCGCRGRPRLQLMEKNAAVVLSVVKEVLARNTGAVLLVATNPVDVMTYVALRCTGWDKGRIAGSGTVLDSARLRHLLSKHLNIDVHNVHGYVLGEHGDTEFVAWSMAHVAGMPIDEYCPICGHCADWGAERRDIEQSVRDSAYHIIDYKGSTSFGIGLALVQIAGAILRSQHSVLTVSTLLDGHFGIKDVCLSAPCIVSETGVVSIVESKLAPEEHRQLSASATALKKAVDELGSAGGSFS